MEGLSFTEYLFEIGVIKNIEAPLRMVKSLWDVYKKDYISYCKAGEYEYEIIK